jgi:hypothetical protein
MYALVMALWYAAVLAHFEGKPAELDRLASDLIELSTRQNFPYWLAVAAFSKDGRAALPVIQRKVSHGSRMEYETIEQPVRSRPCHII